MNEEKRCKQTANTAAAKRKDEGKEEKKLEKQAT